MSTVTHTNIRSKSFAIVLALLSACGGRPPDERGAARLCDTSAARAVVERLGERMKDVSLLAPDSVVARQIRDAYASLVTPELLARWLSAPTRAPGRAVSSPWPERIDVRSVDGADDGACRVEGEVIYATSAGAPPSRTAVAVEVRESEGWRISDVEYIGGPGSDPVAADGDAAQAVAVIRRYYAAIAARDYRAAYELWSGRGESSGQKLEEFASGYARTARAEVRVGAPGRIEGAAGSRFVEVPVVVRAVTDTGEEQRFEGSYVLRRSVVDGATAEQRRWRIHSADLVRTE